MHVSKSKDCRIGFRIDSWDLERLAGLLGGDELVTGIAVEMGDGSSYQLKDLGELQGVDNAAARPIRAITMESAPPAFMFREDNPPRVALVTIRDGACDTIRYHVSGPLRAVDSLTRELDEWVASLRPWYSSLAAMDRAGFFLRSTAAVGATAALVLVLYLALARSIGVFGAPTPGRLAWLPTAGGLLAVAAVAVILNLRRHRLLPVAQFRIGQGAEDSDRLDRRRARLLRAGVGAAIVTLCGSIVGVFLA
jgi:hypothetical protein